MANPKKLRIQRDMNTGLFNAYRYQAIEPEHQQSVSQSEDWWEGYAEAMGMEVEIVRNR